MGEYAKYDGEEIKIGTCEDMYYLRASQAHLVTALPGNVDPVQDRDAIRFRFPFPDEDGIAPGSFGKHEHAIGVHGLRVPAGVAHCSVQFSCRNGLLVSLPCPESDPTITANGKPVTIGKNGYGGEVQISQQRWIDKSLVLIAKCGSCHAAYRYPTLEDVKPVLDKLAEMVSWAERDQAECRASFYREIARRIEAGYEGETA